MGFNNLLMHISYIGTSKFHGGEFGKYSGAITLLDKVGGFYATKTYPRVIN